MVVERKYRIEVNALEYDEELLPSVHDMVSHIQKSLNLRFPVLSLRISGDAEDVKYGKESK